MSPISNGFNIPSEVFAEAVNYFWEQRRRQATTSVRGEGQGRSVRGGMHLGGVQGTLFKLMRDHGVPATDIFTDCALHKTGKLELPGYFRPTKQWDLLVVRDGSLLAAMELKAQVGPSFGNNFNNRTEEAMGSALDLWTAYREGAFNSSPAPWLGYLFLLEDSVDSTKPVINREPHFKVFEDFKNASYSKRYELFCRRLVRERTYTSACFIMSANQQGQSSSVEESRSVQAQGNSPTQPHKSENENTGNYREPAEDLNARQFINSLLRAVVPN